MTIALLFQDLSNQLGIVYDLILQLHGQVEALMNHSQKELTERSRQILSDDSMKSQNDNEKSEYTKKRREFVQKFVSNSYASLKILAKTYRVSV